MTWRPYESRRSALCRHTATRLSFGSIGSRGAGAGDADATERAAAQRRSLGRDSRSSPHDSSNFCCKRGYAAVTGSPAVQPFDILLGTGTAADSRASPRPPSARLVSRLHAFATNLHESCGLEEGDRDVFSVLTLPKSGAEFQICFSL
jgi:hypothetical protein